MHGKIPSKVMAIPVEVSVDFFHPKNSVTKSFIWKFIGVRLPSS